MPSGTDKDRVDEWQQLMRDWEIAQAEYERAAKTPGHQGVESEAARKALSRLAALKQKIDAAIAEGRAQRTSQGRDVAFGNLVTKPSSSDAKETASLSDRPRIADTDE